MIHQKQNWFVRGDIDGFFGLFIDNLLQLMLVVTLCPVICGIPVEFTATRIFAGGGSLHPCLETCFTPGKG